MAAKKRDFKHFAKIRHPARRFAAKAALFIAVVFLFTTFLTGFFFDSFSIGSAAMEPTLSQGEKVLSTPLVFGPQLPFSLLKLNALREPERGELVVCSPPYHEVSKVQRLLNPFIRFFTLRRARAAGDGNHEWESSALIKRVIAVPGDTVVVENFIAFIKPAGTDTFVNERVLNNRRYSVTLAPLPRDWQPSFPFSGTTQPVELGENEYFVLGDNRSQSHDSRHFGPIGIENILQKVLFRYFPLRKLGAT
ncbi:MAG: signal peptidase I [Spirochaetales bacterium]|nr:signal peptidase I [Spirochaetales bacterium]